MFFFLDSTLRQGKLFSEHACYGKKKKLMRFFFLKNVRRNNYCYVRDTLYTQRVLILWFKCATCENEKHFNIHLNPYWSFDNVPYYVKTEAVYGR